MINGVHALIYTKDAEKDRLFFRDVLGFPHIDSGDGWLIFALPPTEMGVHPVMEGGREMHELYLMCDDVKKTVAELKAKGVTFTQEISDRGWGLVTGIKLPSGGELGLYEPRHPRANK